MAPNHAVRDLVRHPAKYNRRRRIQILLREGLQCLTLGAQKPTGALYLLQERLSERRVAKSLERGP
jgi:hypothetical protein